MAFYSHKGGVGKTTLSANAAFALARLGKRVLILDTDPQCNLTSYLLPDDAVDQLLQESDSANGKTLWSAVRPVHNLEGPPNIPLPFIANGVYLLPGDIRLSEFEQSLGDYWSDCFKRRLGAVRALGTFSTIIDSVAEAFKIDIVIYDTGPNIGPLNRAIMLDCDAFVVPVACDLFSERALSTLGQAVKDWIIDWETIKTIVPSDTPMLRGKPAFAGYVPQNFRTYGQGMAKAPSVYLRRIERKIYRDLIQVLQEVSPELAPYSASQSKLGQVKTFGRLVQQAQEEGVPIFEVSNATESEVADAKDAFYGLARMLMDRVK
tara:strand:- start:3042 stop:4001 length:960 start_codon:yes stop_codon:yes gene_type:complete